MLADERLDLAGGGADLPRVGAGLNHARAHPLRALGVCEGVRRRERRRVRDHEHLLAAALEQAGQRRPDRRAVDQRVAQPALRPLPRRPELRAERVRPALERDRHFHRVQDLEALARRVVLRGGDLQGPERDVARLAEDHPVGGVGRLVAALPVLGAIDQEGRRGKGVA
jgi:hypothetical protein